MIVVAPSGRTYAVRRQWLPWRQRVPLDTELAVTVLAAVELVLRVTLTPVVVVLRAVHVLPWELQVHDLDARRARRVVQQERVRGWGASQRRVREIVGELHRQHVAPEAAGFPVVVTRSPVPTGDDATDGARVYELDDRLAHPTLADLVTAVRDGGPFDDVSGTSSIWVLREGDVRQRPGRPLAVFALDSERRSVDVHPVGDTSFRVAREGRFHLEHLPAQGLERTLELIAQDPRGRRPLREDRQP